MSKWVEGKIVYLKKEEISFNNNRKIITRLQLLDDPAPGQKVVVDDVEDQMGRDWEFGRKVRLPVEFRVIPGRTQGNFFTKMVCEGGGEYMDTKADLKAVK